MSALNVTKDSAPLTGIVIRQAMDKSSPILTNSPDIIVSGSAPAADPASFIDPDAYGWYFSQAAVSTVANYLYIRGLNYTSTGTQQSHVYLYYAQSDQILDPTKWQSTGFVLGGVAQNIVPISATSQWQYVETQAVVWTPPVLSTLGATYFLITWIDNSNAPTPPVFPSTPFANLAALTQYIQQNAQMAVLDTVYRGAFLRQFPGQTIGNDGTGAQTSPDIVVNGVTAAVDASVFASAASYNSTTLHQTPGLGARNFVYLRAINTRNGPGTSRVYLYWTTTAAISPPSWQSSYFTFAGQAQNWIDLTATTPSQIMSTTVPLVWNAPPLASGSAYVLIAYVDNTGSGQPPDFTPFGYVNPQMVAAFVAGHPQLSWLLTNGTAVTPATMTMEVPITAGTGINNAYVGLQLHLIPTDGTVSLSIPGPDAADTIVAQSMKIPDPNALIAWPVTYPNGFATSAVISYTAGQTVVPNGANITATLIGR